MRFRFAFLFLLAFVACSSEETPPATGGVDQCTRTGGQCAQNFPFLCAPGFSAATDDARKDACGMSVGADPRPVKCCLRNAVQDTGVADTATGDAATGDAATGDAGGDASTGDGSATDGATSDAASEASSTDAGADGG